MQAVAALLVSRKTFGCISANALEGALKVQNDGGGLQAAIIIQTTSESLAVNTNLGKQLLFEIT